MARATRSEEYDSEYVQVGLPNKPELSKLVQLALGSECTMSKFAEKCETSLSTISRIVNPDYEIKNPVSPILIRKICDYSADRQQVTLDILMKANGMKSREEISNERYEERDRKERELREAIMSAILGRLEAQNLRYWQLQPGSAGMGGIVPSRFDLDIRSDYLCMIQGMEPRFFNFMLDRTSFMERESSWNNGSSRVTRYTSLFLMDCWESDILRDYWNFIVFTKKEVFDTMKSQLKELKFNSLISLMLIDPESGSITEEFVLPRNTKGPVKGLFGTD